MNRHVIKLVSVLLLWAAESCTVPISVPAGYNATEAELRRHVEFLASPELQGRNNGTEGNRRAAEWIVEQFREAGLKPGNGDSFYQTFDTRASGSARNIIGVLEGRRRDEYIVVAAHYDHLGMQGGRIYPGADDNASGVAILVTLAKMLASSHPDRSILFISFDAEEDGMLGSHYFARSGLVDLKKIKAMICLDLVGGNFFPWETNRVYALGADHDPGMKKVLAGLAAGGDLDMVQTGIYLIEPIGPIAARSDYSAFRNRRVPFTFFSTGTPWYYHTPYDTPDRLNYGKMLKLCRFLVRYARALADRTEEGAFIKDPSLTHQELKDIKRVLDDVWAHREQINAGEDAVNRFAGYRNALDRMLKKETLGPDDRGAIQQAAMELLQLTQEIR